MTETDLCVNKPQSVPVIFEPTCTSVSFVSANVTLQVDSFYRDKRTVL